MTTLTTRADGDAERAGVAVQLIDLHRHYGPVRALDGLTLEDRARRTGGAPGAVGLREDDGAAAPSPGWTSRTPAASS